jgi:methyltransferase
VTSVVRAVAAATATPSGVSGSWLFFAGLCALTGVVRLIEMTVSRRHQTALAVGGERPLREKVFPWMVALHAGVIFLGPCEALAFARPWRPWLAALAVAGWSAAQALRWWVIASLGAQWNVKVVRSTAHHGVVTRGPYRWIRHPNYVAVVLELVALPMVHGAWITASAGLVVHLFVIHRRLATEEPALASDPSYVALMGAKPRFWPWWPTGAKIVNPPNLGERLT